MAKCKIDGMTNRTESEPGGTQDESRAPEMLRREFMKRFGVYAAGSAVGLYVLMSAGTSKARGTGSDGGLN